MKIDVEKMSYKSRLIIEAGLGWAKMVEEYGVSSELAWSLYNNGVSLAEAIKFCSTINACGVTSGEAIDFIKQIEGML